LPGDSVIVETKRGRQLGQVIAFIDPQEAHGSQGMSVIERKANPRDLVMKQVWEAKELDVLISCRERASQLGIKDAKFVKAEYSFDGSWLTISYTTENKKLDIRPLQKAMSQQYHTRIEMRPLGRVTSPKFWVDTGPAVRPAAARLF
jgi:cell fate regulator YaaT (PSP1 superfamily)